MPKFFGLPHCQKNVLLQCQNFCAFSALALLALLQWHKTLHFFSAQGFCTSAVLALLQCLRIKGLHFFSAKVCCTSSVPKNALLQCQNFCAFSALALLALLQWHKTLHFFSAQGFCTLAVLALLQCLRIKGLHFFSAK